MATDKHKYPTKVRILDAAESLFAVRGFDGASLREITKKAEVNLSVIYYYFSSKEDLLRAVIERYLMPIIEEEKAMFKKELEISKGAPLEIRKLLEIFVLPRLKMRINNASDDALGLCEFVFSRKAINENKVFDALTKTTAEINTIYEREFARALPQIKFVELKLRIACLHLTMHGIQKFMPLLSSRFPRDVSKETYLEMLLKSFEAILLAKPTI